MEIEVEVSKSEDYSELLGSLSVQHSVTRRFKQKGCSQEYKQQKSLL